MRFFKEVYSLIAMVFVPTVLEAVLLFTNYVYYYVQLLRYYSVHEICTI